MEVFSAHKQRSCSEGAPRDTTTGDEKTNASFPNVIKTKQKKKAQTLKQRALAGQGDDLELFAASSPSPPGPLPPGREQEGCRRGCGGGGGGRIPACCCLWWLEEPGRALLPLSLHRPAAAKHRTRPATRFPEFQQFSLKIDQSCGRGKATGSGLDCPGPSLLHPTLRHRLKPRSDSRGCFPRGDDDCLLPLHPLVPIPVHAGGSPGFAFLALLPFGQFSRQDIGNVVDALLVGPFCREQFETRRGKKKSLSFVPLIQISILCFCAWQGERVPDMGSFPSMPESCCGRCFRESRGLEGPAGECYICWGSKVHPDDSLPCRIRPSKMLHKSNQDGCSGGALCNRHIKLMLLVPSKGAASQSKLGLCWN